MSLLEIAETCISGECHKDCKYLSLVGGSGGCDTCCQVKLLRDITLLLRKHNIQEDSESTIPYSIETFLESVTPDEIELKPISKVYISYAIFCTDNNLIPEGKIIFGRWICQLLNMKIKQKSINNFKTYRYIKKEA
jgi:hypothetical protein